MNAPMKTDISLQPVPSWSEEDRARADHYALLARLFYAAPDEALLQALVASSSVLGQGQGVFAEAWRALGAAAASHSAAAVADEYAALFISVGKPKVMLNGSWYLTGFLQEEPLAELRDELAELGLGRRQGVAETEDHLAEMYWFQDCEPSAGWSSNPRQPCTSGQKFPSNTSIWARWSSPRN